ncbi:hypothetical protein [Ferruginibacter sp. SUN106]|uniref:hypothetical protein n=1 Tax=Ferruginibacter sp. SUN106 TaxID=2978348 RepID=UPI003D36F7A7
MAIIEWYSEDIGDPNLYDLDKSYLCGTIYHLSYNNETGYVFYRHGNFRNYNTVIAIGKFADSEINLTKEGSHQKPQFNIYNNKSAESIGHFGEGSKFKSIHYNMHAKHKTIFNKNDGIDLKFEVYRLYSNILLTININRTKKKWYTSEYSSAIKGWIEIKDEPDWEFILWSFFCLHHHIESERESRQST